MFEIIRLVMVKTAVDVGVKSNAVLINLGVRVDSVQATAPHCAVLLHITAQQDGIPKAHCGVCAKSRAPDAFASVRHHAIEAPAIGAPPPFTIGLAANRPIEPDVARDHATIRGGVSSPCINVLDNVSLVFGVTGQRCWVYSKYANRAAARKRP